MNVRIALAFSLYVLVGCSGNGGSSNANAVAAATMAAAQGASAPALDTRFQLASGFYGNTIASIAGARELAALPNGDLLVGTQGSSIYIIPNAEGAGAAGAPAVFATLSEDSATSVAYAPDGAVYAATNTTIWKIPYTAGAHSASGATAIARVRQGGVAPNSDGDVHRTTSIVATATTLYAGVGSSCNACVETDPTRATVQKMNLDGSSMTTLATRVRNAIALAINPATNSLWIGGAGQDSTAYGHPYEYFDSPTLHGSAGVDYGWPQCEENHHAYNTLGVSPAPDCSKTVEPAVEFPSYATLIGAAFYPSNQTGAHVFPATYRGGAFITSHGSWHCCPATVPRVYFVAMNGDAPVTPVNWSDPTVQSQAFLAGLGSSTSSQYLARPTGIAIGSQGSLFIADDQNGAIYRIRPTGT
jgi:glucose/arabinose dehydrogenase